MIVSVVLNGPLCRPAGAVLGASCLLVVVSPRWGCFGGASCLLVGVSPRWGCFGGASCLLVGVSPRWGCFEWCVLPVNGCVAPLGLFWVVLPAC